MKMHKFLGSIVSQELFFEEINLKFLVHKTLINESTRSMILNYIASGVAPRDINIKNAYDIYCFEPCDGEQNPFMEENQNYLWFVL